MTPRYPGAYWKPTGDNGPMSRKLDSMTWHEVVSRAEQSIFGYVQSAKVCQAYNGKQGYFEQYMDWDRVAYGVADGNSHRATIESYDGLLIQNDPYREIGIGGVYGDSANTGRWDEGQCERMSDVIAWAFLELGIPIRLMANSRTEEIGHAPHRWGIAPWRVAGGEVWTKHDGKPCPGDLRVQQMTPIIARAQVIATAVQAGTATWLPPGVVDVPKALLRGKTTNPIPPATTPPTPEEDMPLSDADLDKIGKLFDRKLKPITDALADVPDDVLDEKIKGKTGAVKSLQTRVLEIQRGVNTLLSRKGK